MAIHFLFDLSIFFLIELLVVEVSYFYDLYVILYLVLIYKKFILCSILIDFKQILYENTNIIFIFVFIFNI